MRHIIWDFNGTLLADAQLGVDADNHVFDTLGLPRITVEDYRRHMTMPVRNFYTSLGVDLNAYPYDTISRIWLDYFNPRAIGVGLVPGALELVERLKARGARQSILSACYEASLHEQCGALGLSAFMDRMDGLGDESAQPKTEIGRRQLKALGITGAQAVLVGDMVTDAQLAEALGAACILVPWGHNDAARLEKTGMPVAQTMDELEKMLLALK